MSWRDRAIVVNDAAPPADATVAAPPATDATPAPDVSAAPTGTWRDRAIPVNTSSMPDTSQGDGYWSKTAKNIIPDLGNTAMIIPNAVKKVAYDIPKDIIKTTDELGKGTPVKDTTIAKNLTDFSRNSPAIAKDIVRPIVHPAAYTQEHPVGQLLNILGIAGGVSALASEAAPGVASVAEDASNAMGRRATGFTKGLIKGKNLNKANDAVQWMLDKKIMTPGSDVGDMIANANNAKDAAWANMKNAMEEQNAGATGALSPKAAPQLREQFLFDTKKAVSDLEGLRPTAGNGKVLTGGQYDQMNAQVDDAIATIQAHGERPIPWDEANDLKGNLHANFDTTKSNAVNALKKRIYGTFNGSMETQMDAAASARGGNIDKFLEAKKDYGNATTALKGLDNLQSSLKGNRQIGLTDTIAAVGGGATHGPAGALVTIGVKKLLEHYGLRTGATLGQKLSLIASKAPQLLGPSAPAVRAAIAAGGADMVMTHGILAHSDPNYRALVKGLATQ